MPDVKSYKPGSFCWSDLATTDPAGAKRFYTELFGWKTEEQPLPQGGAYIMANVGGRPVSAMSGMMPEHTRRGLPPHWNCYVAVTNLDDTARKATGLGGKLLEAPFDVMDVGRMAVIEDPSGATLSLWQAKKHIGAEKTGEPGTPVWMELETRKVDACGSFYTKLFGWKPQVEETDGVQYTVFSDGKEPRAGMMPLSAQTPPQQPSQSHWTVHFQVTDCNAAAKKVNSLGGRTVVPARELPGVGRFAAFSDPQGALFAVLEPSRRR